MRPVESETYRHEITFRPAWDDLVNGCQHSTIGDHGRESAKMIWASIGFGKGVSWEVWTGWHLPETFEKGTDLHGQPLMFGRMIDKIMGSLGPGAVYFHSNRPHQGNSDDPFETCDYIGSPCYPDVSYLGSNKVEDLLIREGGSAVWEHLDTLVDKIGVQADDENPITTETTIGEEE